MSKSGGKKVQFNIYVDPGVLERVEMLDKVLNMHHKRSSSNVSKSVYWEGVMKEHLNSMEVMQLLSLLNVKVKQEGYLE